MRVLVVGAAGLLGREVVTAAESSGAAVVRASRARRPGWITFDAEADPAAALFAEPVDLVVNCAALLEADIDVRDRRSVRRAQKVNELFPHELARAAAAAGARLVHVSTDAVFRPDAGRCYEDDTAFADGVYGRTKRLGEPDDPDALTLRSSFVGLDPTRGRGLLEWLLAQPRGSDVRGYADQAWNGLAAPQLARVCASLADPRLFDSARREAAVHHLYEDPPVTKGELVSMLARVFQHDVRVVPTASGRPSTRILGTRRVALRECLGSGPTRTESLFELARRRRPADG